MKIEILKENLKNALNITQGLTSSSLTLPILNNILLSTEKNFLKLSSTNLETGINCWVLAKIEKEGKTTIPAKLFNNFVSFLPDKKIILTVKDNILFINCENYKTQIKGINPEEFPIIPQVKDKENYLEVDIFSFIQGLNRVIEICSPNQIRPELSGVFLCFQKKLIKIVATDSFRLAEKTLFLEKEINQEYSLILPQKSARELINIFSEKKGELKIYFSPNQIFFSSLLNETFHSQVQLTSRLIEGEYPDYQEIIPKTYKTQIILHKSEFLNQLRVASLFSGKVKEVRLKIDPKMQTLEMFTQSPEIGENRSSIPGKIKGEKVEISFNYKFLIDGLLNLESQEVIFELNGEDGAAVLKSLNDPNYLYVVMPIKSG